MCLNQVMHGANWGVYYTTFSQHLRIVETEIRVTNRRRGAPYCRYAL